MKIEAIWRPEVQQQIFRTLLDAMSRPGSVLDLQSQLQNSKATRGVLATLLDGSVSLSDPAQLLDSADWPLLEARKAAPDEAAFVLCDAGITPNFTPCLGELTDPQHGATLVLQGKRVGDGGTTLHISGPGVDGDSELRIDGFAADWFIQRQQWNMDFPLGVDLLLVDELRVTALPRTSSVRGF